MAPHKLDLQNQKTSTKGTKAFPSAGVVKRRYEKVRFHENGLLNVERKTGKYFKIARENRRNSLLLRLPPELRCLVFEYALGGKTFEITYDRTRGVAENTTVSKHAHALLSVCRQIFTETALLPFSSNTFSALYPVVLNMWIESFHPTFAGFITSVRIDILARSIFESLCYDEYFAIPGASHTSHCNHNKRFSSVLTSLKFIELAFSAEAASMDDADVEEQKKYEETVRSLYELANSGISICLTRMMA